MINVQNQEDLQVHQARAHLQLLPLILLSNYIFKPISSTHPFLLPHLLTNTYHQRLLWAKPYYQHIVKFTILVLDFCHIRQRRYDAYFPYLEIGYCLSAMMMAFLSWICSPENGANEVSSRRDRMMPKHVRYGSVKGECTPR